MLKTTNKKVRVHPASPADRGRPGKGTVRLHLALSDNIGMPDWFRKGR